MMKKNWNLKKRTLFPMKIKKRSSSIIDWDLWIRKLMNKMSKAHKNFRLMVSLSKNR